MYNHAGKRKKRKTETKTKMFTDGSGKTKKVTVKLFPWEELNYVAKVKKAFALK